jgi:hypothetical protein
VAVPVAQEHIGQSGQQELPGVHLDVGMLVDPGEHVVGALDGRGGGEREPAPGQVSGALFDGAQQVAELLAVLAQGRVVGHLDQMGRVCSTPTESREDRHHHHARGMPRAHLVLDDPVGEGARSSSGRITLGSLDTDRN